MCTISNLIVIAIGVIIINGTVYAQSNGQCSQQISDQFKSSAVDQIDSLNQKIQIESGLLADSCDGQHPGDPTGDGLTDLSDYAIIIQFILFHNYPANQLYNLDPNGDCMINIGDIVYLEDPLSPPPVTCTCLEPAIDICCFDITGNVNYDYYDVVDIEDVVYLVDYQFHNGDAPFCLDEADIDGNPGIDIGDLVHLVNYQFRNGDSPVLCPAYRD